MVKYTLLVGVAFGVLACLINAADYRLVQQYGGFGSGQGRWSGPTQVTTYGADIFISDTDNNRVVKLDANFNWKYTFGHQIEPEHRLAKPSGVCVDSERVIWVADAGNNRINSYLADGSFQKSIGEFGISDFSFNAPAAITRDGFGNLYVCDTGNDRVIVLNSAAEIVFEFGQIGKFEERLSSPTAIVVFEDGTLMVGDQSPTPLKLFDPAGNFIRSVALPKGTLPTEIGALCKSTGNRFWVSDRANARVFEVSLSGKIESEISHGLKYPMGLVQIGSELVVVDKGLSQILRYSPK